MFRYRKEVNLADENDMKSVDDVQMVKLEDTNITINTESTDALRQLCDPEFKGVKAAEIAQRLIEEGADVTSCNQHGHDILTVFCSGFHDNIDDHEIYNIAKVLVQANVSNNQPLKQIETQWKLSCMFNFHILKAIADYLTEVKTSEFPTWATVRGMSISAIFDAWEQRYTHHTSEARDVMFKVIGGVLELIQTGIPESISDGEHLALQNDLRPPFVYCLLEMEFIHAEKCLNILTKANESTSAVEGHQQKRNSTATIDEYTKLTNLLSSCQKVSRESWQKKYPHNHPLMGFIKNRNVDLLLLMFKCTDKIDIKVRATCRIELFRTLLRCSYEDEYDVRWLFQLLVKKIDDIDALLWGLERYSNSKYGKYYIQLLKYIVFDKMFDFTKEFLNGETYLMHICNNENFFWLNLWKKVLNTESLQSTGNNATLASVREFFNYVRLSEDGIVMEPGSEGLSFLHYFVLHGSCKLVSSLISFFRAIHDHNAAFCPFVAMTRTVTADDGSGASLEIDIISDAILRFSKSDRPSVVNVLLNTLVEVCPNDRQVITQDEHRQYKPNPSSLKNLSNGKRSVPTMNGRLKGMRHNSVGRRNGQSKSDTGPIRRFESAANHPTLVNCNDPSITRGTILGHLLPHNSSMGQSRLSCTTDDKIPVFPLVATYFSQNSVALSHPSIEQTISYRWKSEPIKPYLLIDIIRSVILVSLWTWLLLILCSPNMIDRTYCSSSYDVTRRVLTVFILVLTIPALVAEIMEISLIYRGIRLMKVCLSSGSSKLASLGQFSDLYFDAKNVIDWANIIMPILFALSVYINIVSINVQFGVLTASTIMAYIGCILHLRFISRINEIWSMIFLMGREIAAFSIIIFGFYVPYSLAFYSIFSGRRVIEESMQNSSCLASLSNDSCIGDSCDVLNYCSTAEVNGMETLPATMFSVFRLLLIDEYDFNNMSKVDKFNAIILIVSYLLICAVIGFNFFVGLISNVLSDGAYQAVVQHSHMDRLKTFVLLSDFIRSRKGQKGFVKAVSKLSSVIFYFFEYFYDGDDIDKGVKFSATIIENVKSKKVGQVGEPGKKSYRSNEEKNPMEDMEDRISEMKMEHNDKMSEINRDINKLNGKLDKLAKFLGVRTWERTGSTED